MKMGKMTAAMLIGCGLMLAGVLLLPALGVKLGNVLPYLLIAACPLSHVIMMAMGKGHNHGGHETVATEAHDHAAHTTAARPAALPAPADRV